MTATRQLAAIMFTDMVGYTALMQVDEQLAILFGKSRSTVMEHILHVYEEGELSQETTCRKFRLVRNEGDRNVERMIEHCYLDASFPVEQLLKSTKFTTTYETPQVTPQVTPHVTPQVEKLSPTIHKANEVVKSDLI